MKVNLNIANNLNKLSFKGFDHKKSTKGADEYEFNYPHDPERYTCELQIYRTTRDKNGNLIVNKTPVGTKKLDGKNPVRINLEKDFDFEDDEAFAYNYKITEKNNTSWTQTEAGVKDSNGKYNLVERKGTHVKRRGSMYLGVPDSFAPGYLNPLWNSKDNKIRFNPTKKENAEKALRTFSNVMGGNIAGMRAKIPYLKELGVKRFITTPIMSGDNLGNHQYWNFENNHIPERMGSMHDFKLLQKELCAAGMNYVADGAFVNESLMGIHLQHAIKYVEAEPANKQQQFVNWFRMDGFKNGAYNLAVMPENSEFIKYRIVNNPYEFEYDSKKGTYNLKASNTYDPNKYTYYQLYDSRFVSDELLNQDELIRDYDIMSTDNPLEVNNHNDTIPPYYHRCTPSEIKNFIRKFNDYNNDRKKDGEIQVRLDSLEARDMFNNAFTKVHFTDKYHASGLETWDANTDIAKLRFTFSPTDSEALEAIKGTDDYEPAKKAIEIGVAEVQDYVISSGINWTRLVNNIYNEYTAKTLSGITAGQSADEILANIKEKVEKEELSKDILSNIDTEVIENLKAKEYNLKTYQMPTETTEVLNRAIMDFPLESLEFADDTVGMFATSYFTKRATNLEQVGISRFDMDQEGNPHLLDEYKNVYNKVNTLLKTDVNKIALKALEKSGLPVFTDESQEELTELGQYIVPLVAADITKYAVIKSLLPNAQHTIKEDGDIDYDYKYIRANSNLMQLNVLGSSPEKNAEKLVDKLEKGLKTILTDSKHTDELAESLRIRFEGLNELNFRLAEAIIDRTGAGLDWRLDAAKDIGDMDSVRAGKANFIREWQNVVDFWSRFKDGVKKENPNSYLVAEITNAWDLQNYDDEQLRHLDGNEKFRFGLMSDNADTKFNNQYTVVRGILEEAGITAQANYSYLYSSIQDLFSKNFETGDFSNVDSLTIIKKLIGGFNDKGENTIDGQWYQEPYDAIINSYIFAENHDKPRLLHCLGIDTYTIHKGKGIAEAVKYAVDKAASELGKQELENILKESVKQLADGTFKGQKIDIDSFGAKPYDTIIDVVFEQAIYNNKIKISSTTDESKQEYTLDDINATKKAVKDAMLKAPQDKALAIMATLINCPGFVTAHAGQEFSMTGYEWKTKNNDLMNRNAVQWDNVDTFTFNFNRLLKMRKDPRLEPLNNGAPFMLKPQIATDGKQITGILRQSTNGATTISLFNHNGINKDWNSSNITCGASINRIEIGNYYTSANEGLKVGTKFKNYNDDGKTYEVVLDKGTYYLEAKNAQGQKCTVDFNDKTANYGVMTLYAVDNAPNYKPEEVDQETQINRYKELAKIHQDSIAFTGSSALYNPKYNIVTNPYSKKDSIKIGEKISI